MKNINLKELKKDLTNPRAIIPNLLSTSRIAAPFIIPPLAIAGNIPLVLLATSAFMLTDFLDGKIARALNGQTKLGQLLDQISDKVCSIGLLIALIPTIPLMIVPLILESLIAIINIKNTKNGLDVKSTQTGRIKMWPLSISLIFGYAMLISPSIPFEIITYLSLFTAATLEAVNIKEYQELSKKDIKKKNIYPDYKMTKTNKKLNNEKAKSNVSEDLIDYVQQCTNIEDLLKIKEIIEPENQAPTNNLQKIKKR